MNKTKKDNRDPMVEARKGKYFKQYSKEAKEQIEKEVEEFDKKFVIRVKETNEILDWRGPNSIPEAKTFIKQAFLRAEERGRKDRDKEILEKCNQYKDYYNPINDEFNKGRHAMCDDLKNFIKDK